MGQISIAFIVNPVSGAGNKSVISDRISSHCRRLKTPYIIEETHGPGHASALAEALADRGYQRIAIVGGDGSVNEAAQGIIKSGGVLSIIPAGSGNGLARHLGIPLQIESSIETALNGEIIAMDYGTMQGLPFFVTCGVGFDAEIAHAFASNKWRGLTGYIKEILTIFPRYKAASYILRMPDRIRKTEAFTITVANASQYGNQAIIATGASVTDGQLDVCVIKKYPKIFGPHFGLKLFLSNLHDSSFYRRYQQNNLIIESLSDEPVKAQIDGEPIWTKSPIDIKIVAGGVQITVPNKRKI